MSCSEPGGERAGVVRRWAARGRHAVGGRLRVVRPPRRLRRAARSRPAPAPRLRRPAPTGTSPITDLYACVDIFRPDSPGLGMSWQE